MEKMVKNNVFGRENGKTVKWSKLGTDVRIQAGIPVFTKITAIGGAIS